MHQEIIMAGTGGQGIMIMGQLLAHAAVIEDKNIVWFPSYGPESRGGASDCTVILSTEEIGSPVTDTPDTLIALHQSVLDKYAGSVKDGGVIIVNTSLAQLPSDRSDCTIVGLPANEIADELGSQRVMNMVMLGAFVTTVQAVNLESLVQALETVIPAHRHNLLPLNEEAIRRGAREAMSDEQ